MSPDYRQEWIGWANSQRGSASMASTTAVSAAPPCERISPATNSSLDVLRWAGKILAPSRAHARAIAPPIGPAAPYTTATSFSSRIDRRSAPEVLGRLVDGRRMKQLLRCKPTFCQPLLARV